MVGGLALSLALSHPDVGRVTSIGRRPTGEQGSMLREILHDDFTDFQPVEDSLKGHDAAFYCLGVYTGAVPDVEFQRITVDYTATFARALFAGSPGAAFCFLSGQGADQTEKSRVAFAKYKGMAENQLLSIGFPRTHVFRPGYIYPVTPRDEPNISYRIMRSLYPVVRRIYPNIGVSSEDLAKAMFRAGLDGTPGHPSPILENRDIQEFVADEA